MNLCIVVRDTVGFNCTLFPLQDPIHAQLVVIGGSEGTWRRLGFYPNPHAFREKPGRELFEVSVMKGDKAWMEDTQWGDPSQPPGNKTMGISFTNSQQEGRGHSRGQELEE